MAEVAKIDKPVYALTLSKEEARYLLEVLQNPFCSPKDEEPEHRSIRHDVFHALKQAGVNL